MQNPSTGIAHGSHPGHSKQPLSGHGHFVAQENSEEPQDRQNQVAFGKDFGS